MAFLFSVNGDLKSPTYFPKKGESRSKNYGTVSMGKPLVISYLYFFIKGMKKGRPLMISNFCKARDKKGGVAEAVTCYRPRPSCNSAGEFMLSDLGAKDYGHELCYYTDSYLGETVRFTTKIVLLSKADSFKMTKILNAAKAVSRLPVFLNTIPYLAVARTGIKLFSQVVSFFNSNKKNISIIEGDNLDLYFGTPNRKQLQSGRIVVIPKEPDNKKVRSKYIKNYKLSDDNKLLNKDDEEYADNSYYVFQVNSRENDQYKDFDYFQDAAALLKQAQEKDAPAEFVKTITNACKAYNDINVAKEIDALRRKTKNKKKNTERAKALFKLLSSDMQTFYKPFLDKK